MSAWILAVAALVGLPLLASAVLVPLLHDLLDHRRWKREQRIYNEWTRAEDEKEGGR